MLTRLLHTCGLYLGSKDELMPAQADNPDGFWEHLGFVALNDELLNELGGAWDLPPKRDENFAHARLDPLRMKAGLLVEKFGSAGIWGWKDPRNSLTLPFWQNLLPGMKTLIMVRNPLEVAHSMKKRNGTSYSFGLRLWEIYNRRIIETASEQNRLITHYDLFFEDPETELQRITNFIGLSDAATGEAAALVTKRRRHTHFTVDQLIDARVAPQVIDLYRALIAEASRNVSGKAYKAESREVVKSDDADLLPGSVSRVKAFVPERIAQIEHLYQELLAQAEVRHKKEADELKGRLEQMEARHNTQVEELTAHLAQTEARHNAQVEELTAHQARNRAIRERTMKMSQLLRDNSVSLAKSEALGDDLRNRLRRQLKATKKLSRLLDEADDAAAKLRSSARWQIANPVAAMKAKLSRSHSAVGYGHLEKIVLTYKEWRAIHPELAGIDDQIQALISGTASAPARKTDATATSPVSVYAPPVPTRPIEFPIHEEVEISIIIPVFNQLRFTQACLASLQEQQGPERFEVIVVDDCSTDATAEVVSRLPGIVYRAERNELGFHCILQLRRRKGARELPALSK